MKNLNNWLCEKERERKSNGSYFWDDFENSKG